MKILYQISTYLAFIFGVQSFVLGLFLTIFCTKTTLISNIAKRNERLIRYAFFIIFFTGFLILSEFIGWEFYLIPFRDYSDTTIKILSYVFFIAYVFGIIFCIYIGSRFTEIKKVNDTVIKLTPEDSFLTGTVLMFGGLLPVLGIFLFSIKYQNRLF